MQDPERDLDTDAVEPGDYLHHREQASIESILERKGSGNLKDEETILASLKDIVYIRVGIKDGNWGLAYPARAGTVVIEHCST